MRTRNQYPKLFNTHYEQDLHHNIPVVHDVLALVELNQHLEYEVNHDLLTGLFNRRGISGELKKLKDIQRMVSFFIVINNFKNINDFYGHELGDKIIIQIGLILSKFDRIGCLTSRLSGDEFMILLPNFKDSTVINLIKRRLIRGLNRNFKINKQYIFVSSSIGYAIYPDDIYDLDKLIYYSELALYESKINNNDKCTRFNINMLNKLNENIQISNDLKTCIDNASINLVYQSIVNNESLEIEFIETLARWYHVERGNIPPDKFIPIAEQAGLIKELDDLIVSKTLQNYKEIKKIPKYSKSKLTFNVSPQKLLDLSFPLRLKTLIIKNELISSDICVEISENTFMNKMDDCLKQISKLKRIGLLIALDDFGSKYSSLSILNKIEFDIIKVDRIFVNSIADPCTISILKMINEISRIKQKHVIIEGVETKEQIEILNQLGFNLIQGYYYSRPCEIYTNELQAN